MAAPSQTAAIRFYRLLTGTLFAIMAIVCVLFGAMLLQAWREYRHYAEKETELRARLEKLEQHNAYQRQYLMTLLEDPGFFEKVVRSRLGYSRPGEIIFKFEK